MTLPGAWIRARDARARMQECIAGAIPMQMKWRVDPSLFSGIVDNALNDADATVLMLKADTRIEGDLLMQWSCALALNSPNGAGCPGNTACDNPFHHCAGIFCPGDLYIDGDLLDSNLDRGPLLFVGGTLHVRNVIKSGAPMLVCGNLCAKGIVITQYDGGATRIGGNLVAQNLFVLDHDLFTCGAIEAMVFDANELGDLREVLVPELFDNIDDPDSAWPSTERLLMRQQLGLSMVKRNLVVSPDYFFGNREALRVPPEMAAISRSE